MWVRLLLAALLAAGASTAPAWAQLGPMQHLQVGTLDRTYLLDRFHADQATGRMPIVVFLAGLGTLVSEGVLPRFDLPFTKLPDLPPALVVHPQGIDRRWDSIPSDIQTWQRLSGTNGEPADDIGFMRALIAHLVADENGDPARVYVAGISAGGYFAARVACEMADTVAAVADVIATAREAVFKSCNPRPVPFLLLASTTDDTNPYAGWRSGPRLGHLASAPATAFFFARHNGCSARLETALPHLDAELDSTVTLTRFSSCRDDADVLFYRVDGSDHSVPSLAPIGPEEWVGSGRRNRDIETAQILWSFFASHRLATPP